MVLDIQRKALLLQNDTFHNPENTPFLKQKKKHSHLTQVFCENDGTTTITFNDANYFCNISADKCTEIDCSQIAAYSTDKIFYVKKIDSNTYKVTAPRSIMTVKTSPAPRVVAMKSFDKSGNLWPFGCLWLSTMAQKQPLLFYFDSVYTSVDFKTVKRYPQGIRMPDIQVRLIYQDQLNNIFCVTNKGLYINDSTVALPGENVTFMSQDVNGNYWISTLGRGVYCLSKHFTQSTVYKNVYRGQVTFTTEIKKRLFFSLDNLGLYTFQNGIAKCLFVPTFDIADKPWLGGPTGNFLDTNFTYYHFGGHQNHVVSNVLSPAPKIKRHFFGFDLGRHAFKKIVKARNTLYLNVGFGIRSLDLDNYLIRDSVNLKTLPSSKGERMFAIAKSGNDDIWYSSIDSFFRTRNNVGIVQDQYKDVTFKNFDFFGKYLVGITHDNQLLIYDAPEKSTKMYSVRMGCIWENLYRLDSTHVLLSTNDIYYILAFAPSADVPYTIGALEDRFIPLQPESISIGETDCFFFKNGDITRVPKSQLLEKKSPPVLYFTAIETSKRWYGINGPVKLAYNESDRITIAFSALSFSGTAPTYQYSMGTDGKDNWINIQGDINLTNQRFGTYTVKVRAKTPSSDYSTPIELEVTILRPFWATWWFTASIISIIALIIWLIIRRRTRATMVKKEKEHENHVRFIKSEYKAMNALMNPHFVFNSINNVQSLVNNHDVLNATEYLGVFADLIRQNMHNISNDVIPLQKEIELVENYLLLEKLRFEDQLNYSINISENTFLTDIMVPPLLLQPLVENSIKHGILPLKSQGRQGEVQINICEREDSVYIEVKDNGIGMAKAKEKRSLHQSYGLNNIKNRVDQLSIIMGKEISFQISDMHNEDGSSGGTLAVIKMPLS